MSRPPQPRLPGRERAARAAVAAALVVGLPVVAALSWAQESPAPAPAAAGPVTVVAEQVVTARQVVPFGVSRAQDAATVWALGQTRAPAIEPPGPTSPPPPPPSTSPGGTIDPGDEAGEGTRGGRLAEGDTDPTTPPEPVLLVGASRDDTTTTAWRRLASPQDADGRPLSGAGWRPAGGNAALHAGEATPAGAAAVAIELGPAGDPARRPALLARQGATGRFRALPEPGSALLEPATTLFDPAARDARVPFAVVDLPTAAGSTTPDGDGAGPDDATTPGATPAVTGPAPSAATGVLLAPPGGDGVLAWTGSEWAEEPYLDRDGERPEQGRTPVALAATPSGDGVALLRTADRDDPERFHLYRRLADRSAWQEVSLPGPSLLRGALPSQITAVEPVAAPGDPLTVTDGHWWVDLTVTRNDGVQVSATVHLRPGLADDPAPTTPGSTPGGSTPGGSTPGGSTPGGSTPGTDPAPTSTSADPAPTSTSGTTPGTTPSAAERAALLRSTVTGTWCQPSLDACDHRLEASFPTERGYRSQAFPGDGFGRRTITSPVIPESTGTASVRDASAAGGYLALVGSEFALRDGVGDAGDGRGRTEAAAFSSDSAGWIGGARAVGRVGTTSPTSTSPPAIPDDSFSIVNYETLIDLAPSPTDGSIIGLTASGQVLLRPAGGTWTGSEGFSTSIPDEGAALPSPRGIAWVRPQVAVVVGTEGLMQIGEPPQPYGPFAGQEPAVRAPISVDAAKGMDLLDVAFEPVDALSPADGWAVGREGAVIRCTNLSCAAVELTGPLAQIDLRQVVYAGPTALFATTAGLLTSVGPAKPALDAELAALIAADGRSPGIRTVAGLPDGTAVVDGRYARLGPDGAWQRLPSPLEGDAVALAISRDPADPSLDGLRVAASVADQVAPRRGESPEESPSEVGPVDDPAPSDGDVGGPSRATTTIELPPVLPDGRVSQLQRGAWYDRSRVPAARDPRTDLAVKVRPTYRLILPTTPDGEDGWAVGGAGASSRQFSISVPAGYAGALTGDVERAPRDRSVAPTTPAGPAVPVELPAAAAAPARAAAEPRPRRAARAQVAAGASPGLPAAAPVGPRGSDAASGRDTIRILVGGHPACFDECAARGSQRVGSSSNLQQALAAAARIRGGNESAPPVSAVVIGGGRAADGGTPLSRLGARDYAGILRGPDAAGLPVYPVIGTGDASTEAGRRNFVDEVAPPRSTTPTGATTPPSNEAPPTPTSPTSSTPTGAPVAPPALSEEGDPRAASTGPEGDPDAVAYWFEIGADASTAEPRYGAVRVVVIDNAGGGLRGGDAGLQAQWLDRVLSRQVPTIVVGAARMDDRSLVDRTTREQLLDTLAARGVLTYIGTDGSDDPNDLARFGPRVRDTTVQTPSGSIQVVHSAALGHFTPVTSLFDDIDGADAETRLRDRLRDLEFQPAMLAIDVKRQRVASAPAGGPTPDVAYEGPTPPLVQASIIPVFRDLADTGLIQAERTRAVPLGVPTTSDFANGFRWTDPRRPERGVQDANGNFPGDASPDQCRLFSLAEECGDSLPTDVRFTVADPTVAVFVRARAGRGLRTRTGSRSGDTPTIPLDPAGNPIVDARSPILCPLRTGSTTVTISTAGRSRTYPLRITEPEMANDQPAAPNQVAKGAPCSFRYGGGQPPEADPAPVPPALQKPPGIVPEYRPPLQPIVVPPAPNPVNPPPPAPAPPAALPILAPPLLSYLPPADAARPPVVPNPKPLVAPAPPAPPSGLSTQQMPSPNVQNLVVAVRQEERRTEVARESVDHQATIYRAAPRGADIGTWLAGGALALLVGAGGHVAGRRRRLARAARSWLR